jgi:hypothetical protein
MTEFSAHHISSRGLKYALNHSVFGTEVVDEKRYQNALLNVLIAQDFDSIPLVDCFEGEITSIGRRQLHDGDVEKVFILSLEEVSTMPQTSSVIRCIFEVLSNEHHIVFLTDEDEKIRDVVTIGMLTNPIIKEYLTLLIGRLYSEGWDFNDSYLHLENKLDYDSPVRIFEELKKLDSMVDNPENIPPTDFEVSKQIVHILSLLQPLKTWDDGPKSEALNAIDYPLKIATPEYTPGTAGSFAQHPFGAVMENTEDREVQDLAFRMFAEANNWDCLVLKTSSGQYTRLLGKNQSKLIENRVNEDAELEELVHLMNEEHRPLLVEYEDSVYPGIITAQDIVFAEDTKTQMAKQFLKLEIQVRNTYLHVLATKVSPDKSKYYFGTTREIAWKASIADVYAGLVKQLPENKKAFSNSDFKNIFLLRNAMAHNDFAVTPEGEIDPQKTSKYISFLKDEYRAIHDFIEFCEGINTLQYAEFAQIFHSEFKSLNHQNQGKKPLKKNSFKDHFVQLTSREEVFLLHFNNGDVVSHAEKVKLILSKRNFPWKCEILDVRFEGQKIAAKNKAEAAKKATLDRAKQELITFLKAKIYEMLKSNCDENTEIENTRFRVQIQSIIKEARNTFSLNNNEEIMSMTKLSKMACKGSVGILRWCGIEYTKLTRTDDDGKETDYIKIKNLHNAEEE